jgi:hypothetical protein
VTSIPNDAAYVYSLFDLALAGEVALPSLLNGGALTKPTWLCGVIRLERRGGMALVLCGTL